MIKFGSPHAYTKDTYLSNYHIQAGWGVKMESLDTNRLRDVIA